MTRNHFPPHYAEAISPTNLPAELIPQFTTLEYEMQAATTGPPVFLFVVDTCQDDDELKELKDSIQQSLNLLPDDAMVGLITFGAMVHVQEVRSQPPRPARPAHPALLPASCAPSRAARSDRVRPRAAHVATARVQRVPPRLRLPRQQGLHGRPGSPDAGHGAAGAGWRGSGPEPEQCVARGGRPLPPPRLRLRVCAGDHP